MIKPNKKSNKNEFYDDMKEKSIRTHYYSEEKRIHKKKILEETDCNFLFFDPPEIVLQNIELKKVYEIPVRVHNVSIKSKRILIKQPTTNVFKIVSDKKQKNFQISPGLYYEFLVVFEALENTNYTDFIEVHSENNVKIILKLNAYKCRPIVLYDPFINLGFVPVNTKKIEKISFLNEGLEGCMIELRLVDQTIHEIELLKNKFPLLKFEKDKDKYKIMNEEDDRKEMISNHHTAYLIYNPDTAKTVNQIIEIINLNEKNEKDSLLGRIEIIGTSIEQQLSVVFEDGGGPKTEINFGYLFYGQKREQPAFLVNNGPYDISFRMFFHVGPPNTGDDLNDSDFACTPEQAGKEMTQRILGCNIKQGVIKAFEQIPIVFQAKTKIEKMFKWGGHICKENLNLTNRENCVY